MSERITSVENSVLTPFISRLKSATEARIINDDDLQQLNLLLCGQKGEVQFAVSELEQLRDALIDCGGAFSWRGSFPLQDSHLVFEVVIEVQGLLRKQDQTGHVRVEAVELNDFDLPKNG